MNEIATLASYFLLCIVKFMFAPGVAYSPLYKFSFIETFTYTSISGIISVFIFAFLTDRLLNFWDWILIKVPWLKLSKKKKSAFNKRNRLIVKIKNKYGFWGLILISPAFPSIPIGTFIAIKFIGAFKSTLLYMSISAISWALFNSILYYYLYKI